jgi:CheY-like chemotaxis protein
MTLAPIDAVDSAIGAAVGNRPILVVDDDPATLKLTDAALSEAGYVPLCKADAEEALAAAEADPPALVVVDLLMREVDGFTFISRFRAIPTLHDVPIIVWTIKDLDAGERRRLLTSASAIVSKSVGGSKAIADEVRRLAPIAPEGVEGAYGV